MSIKRATRGTKITSNILTAHAWNLMADAAEAHAGGKLTADSGARPQVIMIRNTESTMIQRFGAVELKDPIFKPGAGDHDFSRLAAFDVGDPENPDLPGLVAIAQEPIRPDALGRGLIFGVTPVRDIDVQDESHTRGYAGDDGKLITAEDGPVVILWKEPASEGTRGGVVAIVQGSSGPIRHFARITGSTDIEDAPNRWIYDFELVKSDGTGSWSIVRDAEDVPRTSETMGPAMNTIEASNSEEGIQGNGVDTANLPSGFAIVPIGDGAVVEISGPYGEDDEVVWMFSAANLVDGSCGAEP